MLKKSGDWKSEGKILKVGRGFILIESHFDGVKNGEIEC